MELGIRYPGSGGAREKTQVRSNLQAEVMCLYLGSGVVSDTKEFQVPLGSQDLKKEAHVRDPNPGKMSGSETGKPQGFQI